MTNWDRVALDEYTDAVEALQLTAAEYRRAYRMTDDWPLEVNVPAWYAARLVAVYGSLPAAASAIFRAGAVKIVNDYWHQHNTLAVERAHDYLAEQPWPALRLSDFDDLMRIALRAA